MTQTARKGKLYQLQVLIDLSCFIISHILVLRCLHPFDSTILIHFANTSHKADSPAGTQRFARRVPLPIWEGAGARSNPSPPHTLTTSAMMAGGIGTIIVVLIIARASPEMGRLKSLTRPSMSLFNCSILSREGMGEVLPHHPYLLTSKML